MVHDWEVQRTGPDDIVQAEGPHASILMNKRVLAITPKVIPGFIPEDVRKKMEVNRISESHEIVQCELCGNDGYVGPRLKWMKKNHSDSLYVCCECLVNNCGGKMP